MIDKREILLEAVKEIFPEAKITGKVLDMVENIKYAEAIYLAMEKYKNECLPKEPIPCENKTEEL